MKVLGFEITMRRANPTGELFPAIMPAREQPGPMFFKRSGKGHARIILPIFDLNDRLLCGRMQHLSEKLQKMFTHGWVDVSTVTDIVNVLNLCMTSQTMDCMEKLRLIHCVDFRHLDPALVERIPYMINHIFSEGQLPDNNVPEYDALVKSILV